jgi:hypothetical protein
MSAVHRFTVSTVVAIAMLAAGGQVASGQLTFASGQNVAPVFEGWERQADGSFNMLFSISTGTRRNRRCADRADNKSSLTRRSRTADALLSVSQSLLVPRAGAR